jgi:hypothetical protein
MAINAPKGVWLRSGGKDWMNPRNREARLKPRRGGAGGRHGHAPLNLGLTGKKPTSVYATEIELHPARALTALDGVTHNRDHVGSCEGQG